ncbi:MAG: hypothetical protein IJ343_10925 [Clostridia bacterium]|nr:hypothetical protein [Clostridia bacterium]
MGWLIAGLAVAAAVLAAALWKVKDLHEQEKAFTERVRTSAMYRQLYPVLEKCQECCIEQVLIRETEIRIVLYKPMNRSVRFVFEERGLDAIDQPQTLKALAKALALDVPQLADPDKFYFVTRSAPRDVGRRDVWYEYNVQPDYKDVMLRAWYDRRDPEEGVFH